jgi:hypothetical protein
LRQSRAASLGRNLFRDAESRKKIGFQPDAAGTLGHRDDFGRKHGLFESLDRSHVQLRGPRRHGHAQGYQRKVHVRSGGDPVRCDQLTKAFPGEDHRIGRDAERYAALTATTQIG